MTTKTRSNQSATMRLLEDIAGGPLTIGGMIEAHRQGEEMSQAEMARQLGLSRSHLCDIEKGRKLVSPARAAAFAQALGFHEAQWVQVAIEDMLRTSGLHYSVRLEPARARRVSSG